LSAFQQDVELLRQQLQQAEKQLRDKEEKERLEEAESWEYNMDTIKQQIPKAAAAVILRSYRMGNFGGPQRSVPLPSNAATRSSQSVFKIVHPFMTSVLKCLERLERTIKQQQEKIDNLEKLLVQQQGQGSPPKDTQRQSTFNMLKSNIYSILPKMIHSTIIPKTRKYTTIYWSL